MIVWGESMKKILILLLVVFFIQNNVKAAGADETMKAIMDSWTGENVDTVINHWGYPTDEKTIAGKKLLYWERSRKVNIPESTNRTVNTSGNTYRNAYESTHDSTSYVNSIKYGGGSATLYCNRILEVNASNVVVHGSWEGNRCPYTTKNLYKKWINPKMNEKL